LLDIASTFGKLKDRRMQLKYIKKATDIDPNDFSVKLSMRSYNSENIKREKVESRYDVYRRKIVVLLSSGEKLVENDDYKKSIVKFTVAIERCNIYKTTFSDLLDKALYLRGFAKISIGEFNSGMRDIHLYMGKDKLNVSIESTKILSTGIELYHQEKFGESINHLSVATQFEEIEGEAYLFRAKSYLKINKMNEAYTDLQEAYKLGWLGALELMKNNELLLPPRLE
nr:hypothetical protein [Melioribacteraceae bacterium]